MSDIRVGGREREFRRGKQQERRESHPRDGEGGDALREERLEEDSPGVGTRAGEVCGALGSGWDWTFRRLSWARLGAV